MVFNGKGNNFFKNSSNNRPYKPSHPTYHRPQGSVNGGGLIASLIGGAAMMAGEALGTAVGEAMQPAMNNIGNSVASSIKQNAGTATKSLVDVAQAQKSMAQSQEKIANKKETRIYEYFDECPYCGAGREGENTTCAYCGTSLIKNAETHIE